MIILMKAALAGLVLALCLFGTAVAGPYEDGEAAYDRGDYAAALALLRPLADQGDAAAQSRLGSMYRVGRGVPQDYVQALEWSRKAADQGNANGQANLGIMYAIGEGVPQDNVQALEWSRKAADQGNARGQRVLGVMYSQGLGVPQDYVQGVEWSRKAADQGDATGQANLGMAYHRGEGVPQDYVQAVAWYRKAADQGQAYALQNLGYMYGNGEGVPQDYAQAYKWLSLSAARMTVGAERAKVVTDRDWFADQLDATRLAQAQSEASSWRPAAAEVHADTDKEGSSSPLVGILVLAGLLVSFIGGMIFLDRKKPPSTTLDSHRSAFATDGASKSAGSVEPVISPEASPPSAIPPLPSPQPQPSPTADTDLKPRPWVRYFAKLIDIWVVTFPIGTLTLIFPSLAPAFNNLLIGEIIALFAWALIEPLVLSTFQTTPGRALFRTQLVYRSGQPITMGAAYARSLRVYTQGMGLGMPIVSFVTHILAYRDLTKHGITTWDQQGGFEVRHGKLSRLRLTLIVLIFLSVAALSVYGEWVIQGGTFYPSPAPT